VQRYAIKEMIIVTLITILFLGSVVSANPALTGEWVDKVSPDKVRYSFLSDDDFIYATISN
jgi:hypothetical protein